MGYITDGDGNPVNAAGFRNLTHGEASAVQTFVLTNTVRPYSLVNVRLFVQTMPGGEFTGGTDEQGQEMQDEQWVEARIQGDTDWVPIGGPYGLDDLGAEEGDDFLQLPDLDYLETVTIEIRVNVPSTTSTHRVAGVRLGWSWDDETSEANRPEGGEIHVVSQTGIPSAVITRTTSMSWSVGIINLGASSADILTPNPETVVSLWQGVTEVTSHYGIASNVSATGLVLAGDTRTWTVSIVPRHTAPGGLTEVRFAQNYIDTLTSNPLTATTGDAGNVDSAELRMALTPDFQVTDIASPQGGSYEVHAGSVGDPIPFEFTIENVAPALPDECVEIALHAVLGTIKIHDIDTDTDVTNQYTRPSDTAYLPGHIGVIGFLANGASSVYTGVVTPKAGATAGNREFRVIPIGYQTDTNDVIYADITASPSVGTFTTVLV